MHDNVTAKITNYSFRSCDDVQTPIHAVKWEPEDGNVTATLQIAHGMEEYIERYSEFATFLTKKGFAVFGHDHIGHGYSVERAEDRGIMHCKHPDRVMVRDMFTHFGLIRKEYPDKPCFILGHSMGSYLLRRLLSERADELSELNGAIIMGTGYEDDLSLVFGKIVLKCLIAVKGRDHRSPVMPKMMFKDDYRQFDLTGEHPENSWLSHNVENVKRFHDKTDPRNNCVFSLNGYRILLDATWFSNRMKNIRKMNRDIPVIFVSGDHDPVGQMGEGVKKSYEKFRAADISDLSIRLYEGDRHEILNETDRGRVYEDLYEWMKERFDRR